MFTEVVWLRLALSRMRHSTGGRLGMAAAVQDCCFSCRIISQEARAGFIDALHVELKLESWRCWGLDVSAYVQQVRDLRILGDICNFDIDVRIKHASSAEFNKMVRLLRELCKLVRGGRTRPMRASNIRIWLRRRSFRSSSLQVFRA